MQAVIKQNGKFVLVESEGSKLIKRLAGQEIGKLTAQDKDALLQLMAQQLGLADEGGKIHATSKGGTSFRLR